MVKSKLIIEFNKNFKFAKDILKGWQYSVYKNRASALYKIITKRLKKYDHKQLKEKDVYSETGDKEYIGMERKRLEGFLFSDSSELNKDENKHYKSLVNDRFIQKVVRGAHKLKDKIKDKAIKSALGGTDVLSFYAKVGIGITWRVEEVKE